ncbi:hypothetical protein PG985_015987 [Apiospora marii]|uniref:uncharacterized protein n=1 Tax=Apiospora marii TaxID=335849 RepID=UPI00313160C4
MNHLLGFLVAAMSLDMGINAAPANPMIPSEATTTMTTHPPTPTTPTVSAPKIHDPDPRGPLCGDPDALAWSLEGNIRLAIIHLRTLGDQMCTAPPGPAATQLVVCYDNGAIWLYNDHDAATSTPCDFVADYAQMILDRCGYHNDKFDTDVVKGQLFDIGANGDVGLGWGSVVVGGYPGHCGGGK